MVNGEPLRLLAFVLAHQSFAGPPPMAEFARYDGDGGHNQAFHRMDRDRNRVISIKEAAEHGVDEKWLRYYDGRFGGVRDGSLTYQEFVAFFRERKLYQKADFSGPDPPGHMKPLGSHRPPVEGPDEIAEGKSIEPRVFWKTYVAGHKPLVLRGIGAQSEGLKKWSMEYVEENFGWVDVKTEPKAESRGNNTAYADMEQSKILRHHRGNIKEFLAESRAGKSLYAVTILPQAMSWDIPVFSGLLCGGRRKQLDPRTKKMRKHPFPHPFNRTWMTHIFEANLWLALGRTRSQLHYDKENIVLCTVRGIKHFVLVETRKFYHDIPWVRGGRYSGEDDLLNGGTDWVALDSEAVDLRVFSMFQKVDWMRVTLYPGDCIFMPYSTLHQVTTHEEEAKTDPNVFQVAYSYFFLPQERYDEEACKSAPLIDPGLPIAAMDTLWYYSGKGIIPQGYPDPESVVNSIRRIMKHMGQEHMTIKVLQEWLNQGDSDLKNNKKRVKHFWKQFSSYANNTKKGLTANELWWPNVPLELWLELSGEGDPEGGLPCDRGEKYDARTPEVWSKMEESVDEFIQRHKNHAEF
jgi:hypothetical protein